MLELVDADSALSIQQSIVLDYVVVVVVVVSHIQRIGCQTEYVVHTFLVPIYYWIDTASDPLDLVPSKIHTFTKSYAVRHSWTSRIAAYNSVVSHFFGLATDTLNVRKNTKIKP